MDEDARESLSLSLSLSLSTFDLLPTQAHAQDCPGEPCYGVDDDPCEYSTFQDALTAAIHHVVIAPVAIPVTEEFGLNL